MKKLLIIPVAYLIGFGLLLWAIWDKLDNPSIVAIVSVIAGGLAGLMGSFLGAIIGVHKVESESEIKIKETAAKHALELTNMEIKLRREENNQKQLLAVAKIYREFYKALFELYKTKEWPKNIEELGLLNIYDFDKK